MSKRNISASDSSDNKRKKRSELTVFCAATIYHILKHLNRVPHKGDWRRHRMISIKYVVGEIRWFNKHLVKDSCFKIVTPVPLVCSIYLQNWSLHLDATLIHYRKL